MCWELCSLGLQHSAKLLLQFCSWDLSYFQVSTTANSKIETQLSACIIQKKMLRNMMTFVGKNTIIFSREEPSQEEERGEQPTTLPLSQNLIWISSLLFFTLLHCSQFLFCMKNLQYYARKSANFGSYQATEECTPPETFCFANILFF